MTGSVNTSSNSSVSSVPASGRHDIPLTPSTSRRAHGREGTMARETNRRSVSQPLAPRLGQFSFRGDMERRVDVQKVRQDRAFAQVISAHDAALQGVSPECFAVYRDLRQHMENIARDLVNPRTTMADKETMRNMLKERVGQLSEQELRFVARAMTEFTVLAGEFEKFQARASNKPTLQTADVINKLKGAEVDLNEALNALQVVPVLTAHPTEMRTRDLIKIVRALEQQFDSIATTHSAHSAHSAHTFKTTPHLDQNALLEKVITPLRNARLTFSQKSSVEEECAKTLSYFEDSLSTAMDQLCAVMRSAAERNDVGLAVRLGTWVGGDRDGNRLVTARSAAHAATQHADMAIKRYQALLNDLTAKHPHLSGDFKTIHARLDTTLAELRRIALHPDTSPTIDANAFRNKGEVVAALQAIVETLTGPEHGVLKASIAHLQDAVSRYGFHLCTIDLRQSSYQHEDAVAELLEQHGISNYKQFSEQDKCRVLNAWISESTPRTLPESLSATSRYELDIFQMTSRLQQAFGAEIIENAIIAHTETPSDVLEVMALMHQTNLLQLNPPQGRSPFATLNVVPLVETVDDLERAEEIVNALMKMPLYRDHLKSRDNVLEIMLGYSDSSKGDGTLTSRATLFEVSDALASLEARYPDLKVAFFHGTGGTPARGGWATPHTLEAQPESSLKSARMRRTVQGESIENHFGTPEKALRSLDEMVAGVLKAAHPEVFPQTKVTDAHRATLKTLSESARAAYQDLMNAPDFEPGFFAMTSYSDLGSKLNLGSRKEGRSAKQTIEDMRAIPWVLAWNQIELKLPAWYGIGSALKQFVDAGLQSAPAPNDTRHDGEAGQMPRSHPDTLDQIRTLKSLYQGMPVFRHMIDYVASTLQTVDLDIARDYASGVQGDLAQPVERIYQKIAGECRTLRKMLDVIGLPDSREEQHTSQAKPAAQPARRQLPLLHALQQRNLNEDGDLESRRLQALAIAMAHHQTA